MNRRPSPVSQEVAPAGMWRAENKAGYHGVSVMMPRLFRYLEDLRSPASIIHFGFQGATDP